MGNNTYVTVEENGSTIVFKYVMGTSRPNKESSSEEGVQATVYGPEQEVPVVDDTTVPTTESTEASSETTATETSGSTEATETTGETQASSETQAPTQAPATTITVKAAKTTIYVGASTTVKATVTNPVGSTTFKSSNTGVATVTSAGKVVGKKAGSVTITATNNGKSATVKIKVVQKANPMTVKAKKLSLKKGYKTKSYVKSKAFTVRSAKGTVTFKKSKGDKKITVSSKGKVTVKEGLKKGTYKVTVKVTAKGNKTYKAKTKAVTLKVVVK